MGNSDTADVNGVESENIGVAFCQSLLGAETNWKQTSYNANMRGNYAGIGMKYMTGVATLGVGSTDVFVPQQPYASWTISTTEARWVSPLGDAPTLTDEQKQQVLITPGTNQHIKQIIQRVGHLPLPNNFKEGSSLLFL